MKYGVKQIKKLMIIVRVILIIFCLEVDIKFILIEIFGEDFV